MNSFKINNLSQSDNSIFHKGNINKNIVIEILNKLDDKSLIEVWCSNSYFNHIIDNELFWKLRCVSKYSECLGDEDKLFEYMQNNKISSWKYFYVKLVEGENIYKKSIPPHKVGNYNYEFQFIYAFRQKDFQPDLRISSTVIRWLKDEKDIDKIASLIKTEQTYATIKILEQCIIFNNKLFEKASSNYNWEDLNWEDLLYLLRRSLYNENIKYENVKFVLDIAMKRGAILLNISNFYHFLHHPDFEFREETRNLVKRYIDEYK